MSIDRGLLGGAAVLWLAAVLLAPTSHGAGAALSGHELASLIGSASGLPGVPRWIGVAWYAMPLGAAIVLTTLGAESRPAARARHLAAATAAVVGIASAAFVTHIDITRFGLGTWCEAAAATLALGAFTTRAVSDGRRPGRGHVL